MGLTWWSRVSLGMAYCNRKCCLLRLELRGCGKEREMEGRRDSGRELGGGGGGRGGVLL